MMAKPCIPKGTRDFSVEEMAKRNYIQYDKACFRPLWIPSNRDSGDGDFTDLDGKVWRRGG